MAAYIDETYYTETYLGTDIAAADFPRLALRASEQIDGITFNRIKTNGITSYSDDIQASIKMATCALAEALNTVSKATDNGVISTSESVGGYSYSLDVSSVKNVSTEAITAAKNYLRGTGLTNAATGGEYRPFYL